MFLPECHGHSYFWLVLYLAGIPKGGFSHSYLIRGLPSKASSYRIIQEWFIMLPRLDGSILLPQSSERTADMQPPFPFCCVRHGAVSNWVLTKGHPILLLIVFPDCEVSLHVSWLLFGGRLHFFSPKAPEHGIRGQGPIPSWWWLATSWLAT